MRLRTDDPGAAAEFAQWAAAAATVLRYIADFGGDTPHPPNFADDLRTIADGIEQTAELMTRMQQALENAAQQTQKKRRPLRERRAPGKRP